MTPASCGLHVLLAATSPRAVVIRRGPTRQACLVAWDRKKDRFDVGQWFKGRIYEDRCDLSADGTYMVAFMASQRPPFHTWTTICRPPYLTAMALWPNGSTWGGGGEFTGPRRLYVREMGPVAPGFAIPPELEVTPYDPGAAAAWRSSLPGAWDGDAKRSDGGFTLLRGKEGYAIGARDTEHPIPGFGWADLDANGDLLLTEGGRILRVKAGRLPRHPTPDSIREKAILVADLSGLTFRPLEAPYSTKRDGATVAGAWHPLDGKAVNRR